MRVGLLADKAVIDSFDVGCSRGDALNYPGPSSGRPTDAVRVAAVLLPPQCQLGHRRGKHELHQMAGRTASRAYLRPEVLLHGYENGERWFHGPGDT